MSGLSEAAGLLPHRPPWVGELVEVRSRRWLVEAVEAPDLSASPRVSLACADDDAQGQTLEVYWDFEIDRRILEQEAWSAIGARGFDPPRYFSAFLHTLRWNCVTATDPNLFQSPFRAGIKIDAYQMEPLRKALRMPRVNLFIADDNLRYTPSDCFETFPFPDCIRRTERRPGSGPPEGTDGIGLTASGDGSTRATGRPDDWASHPSLEAAGQAYYEFRAALMVRNDEGMTKTYNRFHDPYENDPEIERLRELHAAMDRAVLDAYGWTDIPTDCEFLLDYEIDEATWGRKKKPYRYRWPDPIRDEVLARLLALNAKRSAEEARTGTASQATPKKSPPEPEHLRYRPGPSSRPALMAAEPELPWPALDE